MTTFPDIKIEKNSLEYQPSSLSFSKELNPSANTETRNKGKKIFHCTFELCNKSFNHRSTLVKHKRIHLNHRPYQCKVCSQAFIQSSNLKRHMLVHTGEKPFTCDQCDKTFTTASNLKIHRVVHKAGETREKFECKHCRKHFLYRSSHAKHEKTCKLKKEDKVSSPNEGFTDELSKKVKIDASDSNSETTGSELELGLLPEKNTYYSSNCQLNTGVTGVQGMSNPFLRPELYSDPLILHLLMQHLIQSQNSASLLMLTLMSKFN